jgi:thioredoxin reductase (NADPH)
MADTLTTLFFAAVLLAALIPYVRRMRRKEAAALAAADRSKLLSEGPRAQHPHIDVSRCIGCGSCVGACPEGDVLGVIAGKASIVNGLKCIGHALCAEACPVGAIEMVMADPSISADLPRLSPELETSVPGMFVVGELGGLALIKNAVNQGRACIDVIAHRLVAGAAERIPGVYDVCIVGAGPGGISASLRSIERGLDYVALERDEFGGTVSKYPRQKLVMTTPVDLPLVGKLRKTEFTKEELLGLWQEVARTAGFKVRTHEPVEGIRREADGIFTIDSAKGQFRSRAVVLAIGRRGTPRKLGIPGEDLGKVMYSLLETEAYTGKNVLVVGGGDSAIEAAMGLADQRGNRVSLSYRRDGFSRIKERNARRVDDYIRRRRIRVVFQSQPVEIRPESVVLDVDGKVGEIPNDFTWIFAGGTAPSAFLEKIGVACGATDLTGQAQAARAEARDAVAQAAAALAQAAAAAPRAAVARGGTAATR